MARIVAVLATVLTKLLDATAIAIVWLNRHTRDMDRIAGFLFELAAFLFVVQLLADTVGAVWALIPMAVYCQLQAIALARRGRSGR